MCVLRQREPIHGEDREKDSEQGETVRCSNDKELNKVLLREEESTNKD